MSQATLYTLNCTNCIFLEKLLDKSGIPYEKCTDAKAMRKLGFTTVPVLEADGRRMFYPEAVEWVNQQSKEEA
ncbi:hypothetical protein H8790_04910 [Oscillibacter hominis]|uniref:Glutaredoxin n=1 Tax=Oscillibacter hominis TaxID=2763056 RepID=A0A7G9B728_9FIRM|nr:hypothetical protein [Oscillibacter hominis]QNL45359.1 hypothetical protein H8790_04910 [Oscillibacter hominis]